MEKLPEANWWHNKAESLHYPTLLSHGTFTCPCIEHMVYKAPGFQPPWQRYLSNSDKAHTKCLAWGMRHRQHASVQQAFYSASQSSIIKSSFTDHHLIASLVIGQIGMDKRLSCSTGNTVWIDWYFWKLVLQRAVLLGNEVRMEHVCNCCPGDRTQDHKSAVA